MQIALVRFDSIYSNQQFFSHRTGLLGVEQYLAEDKVSCSKIQHSDSVGSEARASKFLLIPSLTLNHKPLQDYAQLLKCNAPIRDKTAERH